MSSSAPNALDVRPLASPRKSSTLLATFDRLDAGEAFILVDDQDPMALRSLLKAEHPGEAQWAYLRKGPYVWHVRISRRPSLPQSPPSSD